ncbi:MAG: kelch repeat-containing protein [bacterium]|nr:kelch repeat-containing protein [bacterium]
MKWYRSVFRFVGVLGLLVAWACGSDTPTNSSGPESFSTAGPMLQPRMNHSATLLANGKVLIAGGVQTLSGGAAGRLASAELFDPVEGRFRATGSLPEGRAEHVATLLEDGRVLLAGGGGVELVLYEPDPGRFIRTGVLSQIETVRAVVRLQDGRVLLLGDRISFAEIYDPVNNRLLRIQPVGAARVGHSANLLSSGDVLIAGGNVDLAERYNPESGMFLSAGRLEVNRFGHTAVLLSDGRVLIAGGSTRTNDGLYTPVNHAEVFEPVSLSFSVTGRMGAQRFGHTATLLTSGKVLVAGGSPAENEVYDPQTGQFQFVSGTGGQLRGGFTATRLQDGRVLLVGGLNQAFLLRSEALLFNP